MSCIQFGVVDGDRRPEGLDLVADGVASSASSRTADSVMSTRNGRRNPDASRALLMVATTFGWLICRAEKLAAICRSSLCDAQLAPFRQVPSTPSRANNKAGRLGHRDEHFSGMRRPSGDSSEPVLRRRPPVPAVRSTTGWEPARCIGGEPRRPAAVSRVRGRGGPTVCGVASAVHLQVCFLGRRHLVSAGWGRPR